MPHTLLFGTDTGSGWSEVTASSNAGEPMTQLEIYYLEDLRSEDRQGEACKRLVERMKEAPFEDVHLDVKRKSHSDHPRPDRDDQKNFAKALSGFANSDGGILIWGFDDVSEHNEPPDYRSAPITDIRAFVQRLYELEGGLVQPPADGVEHHAMADDEGKGFAITVVPRSEKTRHMGSYKGHREYYHRPAGRFESMEHYLVEDKFGRRARPKLEVVKLRVEIIEGHPRIRLEVRNAGRAMAARWGVDVYLPHPYGARIIEYPDANPSLLLRMTERDLPSADPTHAPIVLRLRNPADLPLFSEETVVVWPNGMLGGVVEFIKPGDMDPRVEREEMGAGPDIRYTLHADNMMIVQGRKSLHEFVELNMVPAMS